MKPMIVVENTRRWPLQIPEAEVVAARDYLRDSRYSQSSRVLVFNMCRTYGYQSLGYYVSLLASARGQRPLPSVETLQGLRSSSILRLASEDLEPTIQRTLAPLRSREFELSIYFGRNIAARYDRLSQALFNLFPAPFLRARFKRGPATADDKPSRWRMSSLTPIATSEIPEGHRDFVVERCRDYFMGRRRKPTRREPLYELAILLNPEEKQPPSDATAIRRFVKAASDLGMRASVIHPDEYGHLAEYDALFIRETTNVNHHTFRFAQRAASEGMVVIDDPVSIVRCTNKVFLAEAFERGNVPAPRTKLISRGEPDGFLDELPLPCVVKHPDSAFSRGVFRAETRAELEAHLEAVLDRSELAVVQEFAPSEFDWRVGVLAGRPLYACRYYMAKGHWQIVKNLDGGRSEVGTADCLRVEDVPPAVINAAVRAADLVGDGLYGVDLKEINGRVLVIEVNDNPSLESGVEDRVLGNELYRAIMLSFRERLDALRQRRNP